MLTESHCRNLERSPVWSFESRHPALEFVSAAPHIEDSIFNMKIMFFTPSLGVGGAERFLTDLAIGLKGVGVEISAISLGPYNERNATKLRDSGVALICRDPGILGTFRFFRQTREFLKTSGPNILQGWLYRGDLMASFAKRWAPHAKVVWSIRNTELPSPIGLKRFIRIPLIARLISRWVHPNVISCDASALALHVASGFNYTDPVVIGNSVPDLFLQAAPWTGGDQDYFQVGLAARYAIGKGHSELISAFALCRESLPANARCVLVGAGVDSSQELISQVRELGLEGRVLLGGQVDNMQEWLLGLSIYIMSSTKWEGFPNSLLEAVSLGVPSFSYNIGSAQEIVGAYNCVEIGNTLALAQGITSIYVNLETAKLEAQSRRAYVLSRFSSATICGEYLKYWESIL